MADSCPWTLELLLDGAVSDAVRLEHKPRAVVQIAITRLLWKVGSVACVRVSEQQVESNHDKDEDQNWSTVCHYKYQTFFYPGVI